jgi:hypothetical protein
MVSKDDLATATFSCDIVKGVRTMLFGTLSVYQACSPCCRKSTLLITPYHGRFGRFGLFGNSSSRYKMLP